MAAQVVDKLVEKGVITIDDSGNWRINNQWDLFSTTVAWLVSIIITINNFDFTFFVIEPCHNTRLTKVLVGPGIPVDQRPYI